MATSKIHLVEYASQPDIQYKCDGVWDTPKWNSPTVMPNDGVFIGEMLRYYTFDKDKVTCEECLK